MANETKPASPASANDTANPPVKSATEAKPIVTPAPAAAPPADTKKL